MNQAHAKHSKKLRLKPLLALALVATVAIVLFVANKTSTPTYNTTTPQTQQPTTQLPPTQPDPKQPVEDPSYLVIKEWGVRFKLPPELQGDVYYVLSGDGQTATFASKEYDQLSAMCTTEKGGLLEIVRLRTTSEYFVREDSLKTIGEYGFFNKKHSYSCLDVGTQTNYNKESILYIAISQTIEVN